MSEAHARMHLRTTVIDDDIDVAIKVLLEGFITSQRLSAQKQLRRRLRRFIARGTEDYKYLLMHVLKVSPSSIVAIITPLSLSLPLPPSLLSLPLPLPLLPLHPLLSLSLSLHHHRELSPLSQATDLTDLFSSSISQSLMRDQVRLEAARAVSRQGAAEGQEMPSIQVDLGYFEDKAKEYGITDLKPFYDSESFRRGYGLDQSAGVITRTANA